MVYWLSIEMGEKKHTGVDLLKLESLQSHAALHGNQLFSAFLFYKDFQKMLTGRPTHQRSQRIGLTSITITFLMGLSMVLDTEH